LIKVSDVVYLTFEISFNFSNVMICRKIIIAGAKAGIKAKGNFVNSRTLIELLGFAFAVVVMTIADNTTERMSISPKTFQA